jgi:hypothetical protein
MFTLVPTRTYNEQHLCAVQQTADVMGVQPLYSRLSSVSMQARKRSNWLIE